MEVIAVTGGKGGAGKSTYAILLAKRMLKAGKKVALCDADVEAPNLHILLDVGLERIKDAFQYYPKLNEEKCRKCGLCVKHCKYGAIFQKPGEYPTFLHDLCESCGICWHICPYNAIEKTPKKTGEIRIGRKGDLILISGFAEEGVSETGPIVSQLLEEALKLDADVLIVDTAPGMHCNVIRALLPANLVRLVVEHSWLGLHDAKRMISLLRKMGKQFEIVINKYGMTSLSIDELEKYAAIVEKIPYSIEFMREYMQARIWTSL